MRLKRHMAAAALACAAAAGVAGATTAARAQSATPPEAPPAAPRPVEVTARGAEPAPTPAPSPTPTPTPEAAPEPTPATTPQEPTVRIDGRIGGRIGGTIQVGPDGLTIVGGSSDGAVRLAQAAPARVAPQRPSADSPDDPRVVELYRSHFGGQLTKASYLGVSTSHVPPPLRQHLSLPEGVGLVVDFVEEDSPAKTAGLKQYDILTKLNDQVLVNAHQLAVLVRSFKPGEEVKLTLIRGGKEQTLPAKLVEKEVKPLDDLIIWDGPGNAFSPDSNEWRKTEDQQQRDIARRVPNELHGRRPPTPRAPNNPWQPRENGRPGGNAASRRTMTVWRDEDVMITISVLPDGGRHLRVADKSGKALFDGPLDDEKKRGELPPQVAQKVRELEAKIAPHGNSVDVFTPAPPRKPDAPPTPENRSDDRNRDDNDNDNNNDNDDEDENEDAGDDGDDDKGDGPRARGRSPAPIGRDDLLSIAIRDVHGPGVKTEKTTRVRDGRVTLPYVAPVLAEGLTEAELEKRITTLYAEAKIAPNVNVSVKRVRGAPEGAPK